MVQYTEQNKTKLHMVQYTIDSKIKNKSESERNKMKGKRAKRTKRKESQSSEEK